MQVGTQWSAVAGAGGRAADMAQTLGHSPAVNLALNTRGRRDQPLAPLSKQAPPVWVVLPLRGCRPHSRANWDSQLHSNYGKQASSAHSTPCMCSCWPVCMHGCPLLPPAMLLKPTRR